MSNKQLLREWYAVDYKPELIKESREKNGGKLMLQGVIQKANTKNQNKRIYPRKILDREVENYKKAVRENRALGELDHPESSAVALDRASHIIREIDWDGDNVIGRVEILNTPKGQILQSLLDSGVMIGISSRGVGSTEKGMDESDVVQEDYQLICFDIVSEPSTPGAYLGITESKQVTFDGVKYGKGDRIFRALNDIIRK